MREFVYGNDQQYALLKESLNDHMCHVYGHCTFPSSFSKNAGRIGFEKEGTLRFLDFTDMKVFLKSLKFLY